MSDDRPPEDAAGFSAAMVHLYRGEMQRMTVWRSRLDTTSNWAILLTTGMTTFALGSPAIPHYVLLLGLALIGICILIESRRYLHLLHSKWRLFVLEANYFGGLLLPGEAAKDPDWRRRLAADLAEPRMPCTLLYAVRLRLRRNYILLVYFITGVWMAKLFIHPQSPASLSDFHARLAVGGLIPSWLVGLTAAAFVLLCTWLAVTTPSEEALDFMMAHGTAPAGRRGGPGGIR